MAISQFKSKTLKIIAKSYECIMPKVGSTKVEKIVHRQVRLVLVQNGQEIHVS